MQNLPAPYNHLVQQAQGITLLPADVRHGSAGHCWSPSEVAAIVQAWASGRPLLVRGEAGCGKSQLARALATVLQVPLITEVIHPRFEATDLLYRDDPVERLAQAQLLAAARPLADTLTDPLTHPLQWLKAQLNPALFVRPGPIWQAMLQAAPQNQPGMPDRGHPSWPRAVVLIDEIDKADSDVPNALLDVLANRSFKVHPTGDEVPCAEAHAPLLLITTNEDRDLPPAFVRRCAVLNLRPDDADEAAFTQWLLRRARAHQALVPLHSTGGTDSTASPGPLQRAAAQVWADRKAAADVGLPTVGLAEYLDLLYSLLRLSGGDAQRAGELIDQVSAYALVKHKDQQQNRPPVGGAQAGG